MIFYRSFFDAIKELPERNQVEVFTAICEYGFDGNEPQISGISKTIWTLIKPNLQANRKKWESGCKAKTKQTKSKSEAKTKQRRSKTEANVDKDVDVNVDVDVNENEDKDVNENVSLMVLPAEVPQKKFIKPSIQDICLYVQTKNPMADINLINQFAEKFHSFYESNGWKVGKNPMKNWRAAIGTWNETLLKTLNPFKESSAKESFPSGAKKGSWESRQLEYLKGVESILNDSEL